MPRTVKIQFDVFRFDELTEEAQKKAVATIAELRSGAWWDENDNDNIGRVMVAGFAEALKTPGWDQHGIEEFPGIDGVRLDGWSLDQAQEIAFAGKLTRENAPALPWNESIGHVEMEAGRGFTRVYTVDKEPQCTCPPSETVLQPHEDGCPFDAPAAPRTAADEAAERVMVEAVKLAIRAAWDAGNAEMEHMTSEEAAKDSIEANGYEFNADGTLYR